MPSCAAFWAPPATCRYRVDLQVLRYPYPGGICLLVGVVGFHHVVHRSRIICRKGEGRARTYLLDGKAVISCRELPRLIETLQYLVEIIFQVRLSRICIGALNS